MTNIGKNKFSMIFMIGNYDRRIPMFRYTYYDISLLIMENIGREYVKQGKTYINLN